MYKSNGQRTEVFGQMATPGQLVRALAGVLGVPEETVAQHDRNLLVAGLRSKRGRGWAAPNVTARDAAHLLTAILGSAQVKDSAATVRRYEATRVMSASTKDLFARCGIDELVDFPFEHSFVDALEALFIASSTGSYRHKIAASELIADGVAHSITVEALSPGTNASIAIGNGEVIVVVAYKPSKAPRIPLYRQREKGAKRRIVDADLEQHRDISEKTILRVGELLIPDEERSGGERT